MALTEKNMEGLVNISEFLRMITNRVGRASTWLLVPLVIITMWDVVARKNSCYTDFYGSQLWFFFRINPYAGNGMASPYSCVLSSARLRLYS